jgi:transposase
MGRSHGGLTSKIHALVDSNGLPIRLVLSPGEAHDVRLAGKLLSRLKSGPNHRGMARRNFRAGSCWTLTGMKRTLRSISASLARDASILAQCIKLTGLLSWSQLVT